MNLWKQLLDTPTEKLCEFEPNAPDFWRRFLLNPTNWSLKPCLEFSVTLLVQCIFLFYIVLAFFKTVRLRRGDLHAV